MVFVGRLRVGQRHRKLPVYAKLRARHGQNGGPSVRMRLKTILIQVREFPDRMAIAISRIGTLWNFVQSIARARQFHGEVPGFSGWIGGDVFSVIWIAALERSLAAFSRSQLSLADWLAGISVEVGGSKGTVAPLKSACVAIIGELEKTRLELRLGAYLAYRRKCNFVAGVSSADV